MKFLIVAAVVLATACAVPLTSDEHQEWAQFKATHSKSYASDEEEALRKAIFTSNSKSIAEHNTRYESGEESHSLKMNQYGDLHHEEFAALMNGFNRTARLGGAYTARVKTNLHKVSSSSLPDSVDWRDEGYVTPIKNQGSCGSCWSFSATGSLEGQLYKSTGSLVSLSEQNLVDCSSAYGNEGCDGGLMDEAFEYIAANKGIDTEASYPYTGEDGTCSYSAANSGGTDSSYVDIESGSETALQDAVANIGPISVAIDASSLLFQFYGSGIYNYWFCSTTSLDHGVLVVGYGTENNKDYWIVKNSWGTSWGIDGYFKLRRNNNNRCGVATEASYPVV